MKNSASRRVGVASLLAVASLAFALAASAAIRPDDRSGPRGADFRGVGGTHSTALRPDDRAGLRGTYLRTVALPVANLRSDNGFDWSAAGAGAGSATALILLLTGAALILRRNYRRVGSPA